MDSSGIYSTRTAYMFLLGEIRGESEDGSFSLLWRLKIPPKAKVFTWRLIKDRLPTKMNLRGRQVEIADPLCPFCNNLDEDAAHLFFNCSKVLPLWWETVSWVKSVGAFPKEPKDHFMHHSRSNATRTRLFGVFVAYRVSIQGMSIQDMKHKVDLVCIQETKKESFNKLIYQSMSGDSYSSLGSSSEWSKEQDKAFENALAIHLEDASDRWEKIVADVPGKTLEEIKYHYELLVEDVNRIESGCVPLASYNSSPEGSTSQGAGKKGGHSWNSNNESNHGTKASRSDQEWRKGIAWTKDEHRFDCTVAEAILTGSLLVTSFNLLIFQGKPFDSYKVLEEAMFLVWSWLKTKEKGFDISFNHWSSNISESFG
ncbi:Transcription factor SRM1 [Glycine soja]